MGTLSAVPAHKSMGDPQTPTSGGPMTHDIEVPPLEDDEFSRRRS
jgi:hypothetical protein